MVKLCGCKQAKSVPGLVKGVGLCQKHYNMLMFGNSEECRIARGYMCAVYMSAAEWTQHKILNRAT